MFEARKKAYQDAIDDVTRLLESGMFKTAELKNHKAPWDERFCELPPIHIRRRIMLIKKDFTSPE